MTSTSRNIDDGSWCWASKSALKRIADATGDSEGAACRARSVYVALCEIASDHGSEKFTVTKALIAHRAGVSIRTVQRVLPDLQRAGVLAIDRNATGIKTASSYELLTVPSTSGHNGHSSGHNDSTLGQPEGLRLADRVKEQKEKKEPVASGHNDSTADSLFPEREAPNSKNSAAPSPVIPASLDTPEFRTAWSEWLAYRRERKLPKRAPSSDRLLFKKLADAGARTAVAAIEKAICSNWTGIHLDSVPKSSPPHAPAQGRSYPAFTTS